MAFCILFFGIIVIGVSSLAIVLGALLLNLPPDIVADPMRGLIVSWMQYVYSFPGGGRLQTWLAGQELPLLWMGMLDVLLFVLLAWSIVSLRCDSHSACYTKKGSTVFYAIISAFGIIVFLFSGCDYESKSVVLILSANFIYLLLFAKRLHAHLGVFFISATVWAVVDLYFSGCAGASGACSGVGSWRSVIELLYVAYVGPRALHLVWMWLLPETPRTEDGVDLLPMQKNGVLALRQYSRLEDAGPSMPNSVNVVALRAGWGTGKTTVMRHFFAGMEQKQDGVGVWFDCWRHQASAKPEFDIFWAFARHPRLLWPLGWLIIPVYRLYLSNFLKSLKISLNIRESLKVEMSEASLREVPAALLFYRYLDLLCRWSVSFGGYKRVVLVMEDMDRCAPLAAQRYMTLIRRFLSADGLTIVVPYVQEQMQNKVFNPLTAQLPDLAATCDTLLESAFRHDCEKRGRSFDDDLRELIGPVVKRLIEMVTQKASSASEEGGGRIDAAWEENVPSLRQVIRLAVLPMYCALPRREKYLLMKQMEDKYIGEVTVHMQPDICSYFQIFLNEMRKRKPMRDYISGIDFNPYVASLPSGWGVNENITIRSFVHIARILLDELSRNSFIEEVEETVQRHSERLGTKFIRIRVVSVLFNTLMHGVEV